ncbi:MAG: GNAT family N-acetyltransferase [Candidatus Eremiobacteraeota bacterium]|nr:GNAT family N-acetyltransferase [Candidatus Eremiobacteraeota bacterium]
MRAACEAVADSLAEDPFYVALGVDRAGLADYVEASWREALSIGRVDSFGGEGAALWMTGPDPGEAARRTKLGEFSRILSPSGLANYQRMVAGMDERLQGLLPEGVWYLSILGVAPALQGQGWGARLLGPALACGHPSYLETFGERSLRFYQRLGYEVRHRFLEPVTDSPYWVLFHPGK